MKQVNKVLVVNCGSSSLKYTLFDMRKEEVIAKGLVERIGMDKSRLKFKKVGAEEIIREEPIPNHVAAIKGVMKELTDMHTGVMLSLRELDAIGHRVVHGAVKFTEPVLITAAVKRMVRKCAVLAPLHNPANVDGIEACEQAARGVPNVGVFDTAFHQTMPSCAYTYAIPRKVAEKFAIRKYGFHGTSHYYLTQTAAKFLKKPATKLNLITCHLGNGSSLAAVKEGKCVDTTMGLTPLDGMVMGTRCGTMDPSVIFFLARQHYRLEQIDRMLNKESGFMGLTGASDTRDVCAKAASGDQDAVDALDIFGYRAALYIGGYNTILGNTNAIIMAGGIGENSWECREAIIKRLGTLGVKLDKKANKAIVGGKMGIISAKDSKIPVIVIPTNEELMIARQTVEVMKREALNG